MDYSPWDHKELDMIEHLIIALNTKGRLILSYIWDFPSGPMVKNLSANPENMGLIPGLGRSHMLWGN